MAYRDQCRVGKTLFTNSQGGLETQLKNWWYPPPAPNSSSIPLSDDNIYFFRPLFLWMPKRMWGVDWKAEMSALQEWEWSLISNSTTTWLLNITIVMVVRELLLAWMQGSFSSYSILWHLVPFSCSGNIQVCLWCICCFFAPSMLTWQRFLFDSEENPWVAFIWANVSPTTQHMHISTHPP